MTKCWEWPWSRFTQGYGRLHKNRKALKAHRVIFEALNGPLKRGEEVCHRCDNPPCVRPSHLFRGTRKSNAQDSAKKGRQPGRSRWKKCLRGHDLTNPKNIYYWQKTKNGKPRRHCKVCVRTSQKERGYR